jgi:hypothetical protein
MDFFFKSKIRFELIKTNSKYLTKYKAEFLVSRLDVPSDEQAFVIFFLYLLLYTFSLRLSLRFITCNQSHYREVPRWEIFMEQELRFGLDLGGMADFPAFIASKSFDL